jgi:hypothetical protein
MMCDFDFGSGQYRLIQCLNELIVGEKYLVRIRNPARYEFILKYRGSDQINLTFDIALYMRNVRGNNLWAPPIGVYRFTLFRTFSHMNVSFNDEQVNDNKHQIFSLECDGNYITLETPPEMLRGLLDKIILETYNVCRHNNLPPEIGFEIKGFLTNKTKRTKK